MKNKYYFFMTFLLGLLFVFVGIFAFLNSAYFMYMIVMVLGILIFIDTLSLLKNLKTNILGILIHLLFACIFIFTPKLPLSIVVFVISNCFDCGWYKFYSISKCSCKRDDLYFYFIYFVFGYKVYA